MFDKLRRGFSAAFDALKVSALALVGVVGLSVATAGTAMATSTLGQTAATAITGAESEIGLVQGALIGLLVLLVIFMFIRRSMGK